MVSYDEHASDRGSPDDSGRRLDFVVHQIIRAGARFDAYVLERGGRGIRV